MSNKNKIYTFLTRIVNSLKNKQIRNVAKARKIYYEQGRVVNSAYRNTIVKFVKEKHIISRIVIFSAAIVIFFTVANVFLFALKPNGDNIALANTGDVYEIISSGYEEEYAEDLGVINTQSVRSSVGNSSTSTTREFYSMLASDKSLAGDGTISIEYDDYMIKHGDNLTMVSRKIGARLDTIVSVNKLSNANVLRPGQTLRVPNRDGLLYTIKKGETIDEVSQRYEVPLNRILSFNKISSSESIIEGSDIFLPGARYTLEERIERFGQFFSLPLAAHIISRVSSRFGYRSDPFTGNRAVHSGTDIPAPANTPVYAARRGVVTFAGYSGGYGKLVIVRHDKGFVTYYGHLNTINIREGATVGAGTKIGGVGSTGRSTGNHLHFEIRLGGKPVNPNEYVSFKAKR